VLLAHLSDLHLRDETDAVEFERQLDCIVAEGADHLVISGDLLDRWNPPLFTRALDALGSRGCLDPARLTIIHGNHDLASSGGHPRRSRDLWRMALRFWDPPPLLRRRRDRFYRSLSARGAGLGCVPPFRKEAAGIALAAVDSVPFPWRPFAVKAGGVSLQHARGAIGETSTRWLASQSSAATLIVVIHHYPLLAGSFVWRYRRSPAIGSSLNPTSQVPQPKRGVRWDLGRGAWDVAARTLSRAAVEVPMDIAADDKERLWSALDTCGASLIVCGHVHRARLEHHRGIAVGLNGQSGADWAGRTIAFYRLDQGGWTATYRKLPSAAATGG
jgi:UDP-2,3-diacylglucosamine pyrophosphatase LpxH